MSKVYLKISIDEIDKGYSLLLKKADQIRFVENYLKVNAWRIRGELMGSKVGLIEDRYNKFEITPELSNFFVKELKLSQMNLLLVYNERIGVKRLFEPTGNGWKIDYFYKFVNKEAVGVKIVAYSEEQDELDVALSTEVLDEDDASLLVEMQEALNKALSTANWAEEGSAAAIDSFKSVDVKYQVEQWSGGEARDFTIQLKMDEQNRCADAYHQRKRMETVGKIEKLVSRRTRYIEDEEMLEFGEFDIDGCVDLLDYDANEKLVGIY
ncbi:MAG: hypothetical protein EZS28_010267 [Streblomastix strix]|uniref:Uncharacterized protein n=1 Tax=Streblomastix strix TaxID=222440 RepID=A0A5J4WGM5_9EUKA|nr:MAG: hypothetical protein EZS28_010267 [Streblomastix strix]